MKFYLSISIILITLNFVHLSTAQEDFQLDQQAFDMVMEDVQTSLSLCFDTNSDGIDDCCDANINGACDPNECKFGPQVSPGLCPTECDRNGDGSCDNLCDGHSSRDFKVYNTFFRGDANQDGSVDLSDAIFTLRYLFAGGSRPQCLDAADINDDETLNLADAVYTLLYNFMGGDPPAVVPPDLAFQACMSCRNCRNAITLEACDCDPAVQDCEEIRVQAQEFCTTCWTRFSNRRLCDIYTDEQPDLGCESYHIQEPAPPPEICEVENIDENGNGVANEGCEDIHPKILAFAPTALTFEAVEGNPVLADVHPYIHIYPTSIEDHGAVLLELSNQKDLRSLEVKIISGTTGERFDPPEDLLFSTRARDMFTLYPSLDELQETGFTDFSITGSPFFWEDFEAVYEETFPPGVEHYIEFTIIDNGGNRDSTRIALTYETELTLPHVIIRSVQTLDYPNPINTPATGEACSCENIRVYYSNLLTRDPPFVRYDFGLRTDGGLDERIYSYIVSDSMQRFGEEDNSLLSNPLFEYPSPFGLGEVKGVIPLEILDPAFVQSINPFAANYFSNLYFGEKYTGFHKQVKADVTGEGCFSWQGIQSTIYNLGRPEKHLTCQDWSDQHWPPRSSSDFDRLAEHKYEDLASLTRPHAGVDGWIYCPNGFTFWEKISPSLYYFQMDVGSHRIIHPTFVKKKGQSIAWQETYLRRRDKDPSTKEKNIIYKILDIVVPRNREGSEATSSACYCMTRVMVGNDNARIIGEPFCRKIELITSAGPTPRA